MTDNLEFWILALLKISVVYKVCEILEWAASQTKAFIDSYRLHHGSDFGERE